MVTFWSIIIIILAIFWLFNKLWCFKCKSSVCLVGKTALITGGASGIGLQTALVLASKGCKVIIADIVNIAEAVEEIKKRSHNPNIIGKKVELQSLASVRALAKDILSTEPRLNILICNAGIGDYRAKLTTEDGLERTMQINYFSHFLLTHLLLNLLIKSAPSRIVFTSSLTAYFSDLTDVDKLKPNSDYYKRLFIKLNGGVYSNSKLALAAAAKSFGEKLKGTGVTANAVHLGVVQTSIFWKAINRDKNIYGIPFLLYVYLYGKSAMEGAQTILYVAHANEVEHTTAQSFIEARVVPRPPQLTDEFCQQLWNVSINLTHLQQYEVIC